MEIALAGALHHPSFENRMDLRRVVSWCLILLLHVGFFYALNNGLVRHVSAIPHVLMAILIPAKVKLAEVKPVEPPKQISRPRKIVPRAEPKPPPRMIESSPAPAVLFGANPVRDTTPLAVPHLTAPTPPAAAPVPAPAPVAATPKTISGVEYLQPPRPEYPPASRRKGEEGVVQLRVLISEQGRAERIHILTSSDSPRLDEAARLAVQRALFKPYLENGRPLAVYAIVPIRFHLD